MNPPRDGDTMPRRGMLLLLVLSILALFVVVGAIGILLAIRARETARAFAEATNDEMGSAALARAKLDEALLKLIRGPSNPVAGGRDVTESLLEDKYGMAQTGTVTNLSAPSGSAIITGAIMAISSTVSLTSTTAIPETGVGMGMVTDIDMTSGSYTVIGPHPQNPAAFAGRLLTLVPAVGDTTGPTSHRILRFQPLVTTTTGTLRVDFVDHDGTTKTGTFWTVTTSGNFWLANGKLQTPQPLPSVLPCDSVINGREFSPGQRLRSGTTDPAMTGPPPLSRNEAYDAFVDPPTEQSPRNPFLTQLVLQSSTISRVERPAFRSQPPTPPKPVTVDNDGDGVADGIWLEDVLAPQRTQDGRELRFDVSYLVLDLDGRLNVNAHGSFVRALTASTPASTYLRDPRPYVPPAPPGTRIVPNPNCFPVGLGYGPADVDASLLVSSTTEVATGAVPAQWTLLLRGGTVTTLATTSTTTQWRPRPQIETTQSGRYGITTAATTNSGSPGGETATGLNPLHSDFWVSGTTGGFARSPTDLKGSLQALTEGSPPVLRFIRPAVAWANPDVDDVSPSATSGTVVHPYRMRLDEDAPRGGPYQTIAALPPDAVFTPAELERILRQYDADASLLAPRLAALLDDRAQASRMTLTTDSWDTPAITGSTALLTGTGMPIGNAYDVHSPEVIAGLRFNVNRPILHTSGSVAPAASARQEYFRHLYCLALALSGTTPAAAAQWAANVVEFRDADSIMGWYPYDPNPFDGNWTSGTGVWGAERPEMVITSASNVSSQVLVVLYRPWAARLSIGTAAESGTTERIDPALGNATTNTLNAALTSSGTAVWRLSVGGSTTGLNTLLATATTVVTNTTAGTATLTVSGGPTEVILQRLADPTKAFGAALDTGGSGTNAYVDVHRVSVPTNARTVSRWLHWPNRDLVSHGELLTVPVADPATLPESCFDESREASLARNFPAILDATIVPSRFVGAHVSVANPTAFLAGTGYENFQHSQFSRWREAGRVNVNTIVTNTGHAPERAHLDNAVWLALMGRHLPLPTLPIVSDRDLVVTGNDAVHMRSGADFASAFLGRATAIRLANVATVRSHVFAVWITLRITDPSNPDAPQFARLFAIVDRSIPVGAAPGRTLNVRETIRLRRHLP